MESALPFKKNNEEQSLLEQVIRSSAGVGVGFGAYWAYRTQYEQMKRKFMGLPISQDIKRRLTRSMLFAGTDFEKTEFETKLGIKSYLEVMPLKSQIEVELDFIEKKKTQILAAFERTEGLLRQVEEVSSRAGVRPDTIQAYKAAFQDFRDNYFQKAVSSAEAITRSAFPGKGEGTERDMMRSMSSDQIEILGHRLEAVQERLEIMEHRMNTTKNNVVSIQGSLPRRMQRWMNDQGAIAESVQEKAAMEVAKDIERLLETGKQDLGALSDITPGSSPVTPHRPMMTRYWTMKTGQADLRRDIALQKMIGKDAYRSIAEVVRESYRDSVMGPNPMEERLKTAEFMKHVKDTLRSMEKSTVTRGGKTFKQFSRIDVAVSGEMNDVVVIRAKAADPSLFGRENFILRYEVPRSGIGGKYISKDGKQFLVPFNKQKDLLMEQARGYLARFPWDDPYKMGQAQTVADDIRHRIFANSTILGRNTLSDIFASTDIDQAVPYNLKDIYNGGFENFGKVLKNRMARGGILHIDTEFANNKSMPHEIGWVLRDSMGNEIDGYHFIIGPGRAAPAHLVGKQINGHAIVQVIDENQIDRVIDALSKNMTDPRLRGAPISVAGKNWGMAEGVTIENLLQRAESTKRGDSRKITQIRAAIKAENVIDLNHVSAVSGNVVDLKGAHLFRLLREQVAHDPELKEMVEKKLLAIGIPGLTEAGQETFEKGLHTAFQDAYMQGLYPEIVYLSMRKGQKGFYKRFQQELEDVKMGFLPKRFFGYTQERFNAVKYDLMWNESPSSYLKGRINPTSWNISGSFPHLRPGRGDRTKFSMPVRFMAEDRLKKEMAKRIETMGKYADPAAILKNILNDIEGPAITFLDAGQTGLINREEFLMHSKRKIEFFAPYVELVDEVNRDIRPGVEVGFGAGRFYILGQRGGRNAEYRALDRAHHGTVRSIERTPEGQYAITVDRVGRVGANTPVLGPQAGLISATPLQEIFPHIGPEYFAKAAGYIEKQNPGATLSDMFSFMFEHAGNDRLKKDAIKEIFTRRFRQKSGDVLDPKLFPLTEKNGMLTFKEGNRDFWKEVTQRVDIGDYVEIAEEYNRKVNGAFVATKVILDATKPQHEAALEITQGTLKTFGNMVMSGGRSGLSAHLRMAMGNIRRETAQDPIANLTNDQMEKLVASAEGLMGKGKIFEAMRVIRPDIVRALKSEGRNVSPLTFFSKLPAHFGFVLGRFAKAGSSVDKYVSATISRDPINLSDISVFSRVGEVGKGNALIGLNFLNAVSNLKGSDELVQTLLKDMYSENAITLAKMFPHSLSTGAVAVPNMQMKSLTETTQFLDKWIRLPSTSGMEKGWTPAEPIYDVNGVIMTQQQATETLGINSVRFEDAIKDGRAKPVSDYGFLRKRMRHVDDVQEMLRAQPFLFNFGRHIGAHVPGSTQIASHHQALIAATNQDYYLLPFKNTLTKDEKLMYIESPAMAKLRSFIQAMNSGTFTDPDGKNGLKIYHEYLELLGEKVLKREMYTRQTTTNIPVIRLKAHAVHELVSPDAISTKAGAMNTIKRLLGVKDVNRSSFLHARGIMPTEGLLVGDDDVLNKMVQNLSWDDMRAAAKRMTGNVQFGNQTGFSPRSAMLNLLAKEDDMMADALGTLRNIIDTKTRSVDLERKFHKYFAEGVYGMPLLGAKYPLADQTKFAAGLFYKANATAEEKARIAHGSGTGRVGVVTHGSLRIGNIDADKDVIQFLMGHGEKILNIMEKNSFLPEMEPMSMFVDTDGGMVTTFNNATMQFEKHPISTVAKNLGFSKANSMESELITKQFAGQVTIFSENVRMYMQRMLGGKGGKLANDLGQDTLMNIQRQTYEATGALMEGILKGKMTDASTGSIKTLLENFGNYKEFRRFAEDVSRRVAGDPNSQLVRLTQKIKGTEELFPGTKGVNALEIMLESMRAGRGQDTFSSLLAEERVMGTAFKARDLYGMKGAMVQAMENLFFTQGIPTRFNPMAREGMLKTLGRNLQNEMNEKTWKTVSTGMGWLAGASALYLASNIFNPNDNEFLGPRPGAGGEAHDWTFTRPEYKMAALLDSPDANPYAKNRAYVVMDNPMRDMKMARLSQRERRDMLLVHEAVTGDRIRDVFSTPSSSNVNGRSLLERFGHT